MKRIGLTQRVDILADRNERRDALDQAWTRLLLDNGLLPFPIPNGIQDVQAYVEGLGLGGIILTGGNDLASLPGATQAAPERDRLEADLLEVAARKDLPVLGVCRGMQMMGAHYGSRLAPVQGHAGTRHGVRSAGAGTLPLKGLETVNSFHRFGFVPEAVGSELEIEALSDDGSVEALRHRRRRQIGIMWHPERGPDDSRASALLAHVFGGRTP